MTETIPNGPGSFRRNVLWRKRTPEETAEWVRRFDLWRLHMEQINKEYPLPDDFFDFLKEGREEYEK